MLFSFVLFYNLIRCSVCVRTFSTLCLLACLLASVHPFVSDFICSSVCWSCSLLKRFYISCIRLCIFGTRRRERLVKLRRKGRLMRPNLCIPTGTKITNRDPARTTAYPSYGAQLGKTLRRQLYTPTGESQESKPSSNHCQNTSKTHRLSHVLVICKAGYMILSF